MNQRVKDIALRIKGLRLLTGYTEDTVAGRLGISAEFLRKFVEELPKTIGGKIKCAQIRKEDQTKYIEK